MYVQWSFCILVLIVKVSKSNLLRVFKVMASNKENEHFNTIMYDSDGADSADDNDSDKKKKRSSKTTKPQIHKIQMFMQKYPDFTKGKADKNQTLAWGKLSEELNAIGPPYHSSLDWRVVWTNFKANRKRKEPTEIAVNDGQSSRTIEGTLPFI